MDGRKRTVPSWSLNENANNLQITNTLIGAPEERVSKTTKV